MREVSTIGLDLAKSVFQVHGADASGAVLFRKKLRRHQVLTFLAGQPPCTMAMEACGSSHHWAHEIGRLGHTVRLIPPAYVKPFVKRQKNDAADAEAICEAAQRPTMRVVVRKSEQAQAAALVFRVRDLQVRQRTQVIDALRRHLTEFGIVVAKGPAHVDQLVRVIEDPDEPLPEIAQPILQILVETLHRLDEQIAGLDREVAQRAEENETARRLMTIPGVGPVTAVALAALAPPAETFKCGRDFAAWVGLTPLQHSTGGKQKLGATSKMGERTLRRLLIIGANSVLLQVACHGAPAGSWIARMVARKPPMLVRVALANKMARIVWALLARGEVYRTPAVVA
jgi:transposase